MDTRARARELRRTMTIPEVRFWQLARAGRLGVGVRRQLPIGPYIADFAIPAFRLVIELDGDQHLNSPHDQARDAFLAARGWKVLRFWNREMLQSPEGVIREVLGTLQALGAKVPEG
ncbi:MAG TPA: DUF559 domain-containing protein [Deinococcales bacterium]|nr:DUF559 domain-containing protein [Deinococcales bacterium]